MLKLKLATKFNANINPSTKLITLPPGFNCDATLDHEGWPKRNKVSNHIFHMNRSPRRKYCPTSTPTVQVQQNSIPHDRSRPPGSPARKPRMHAAQRRAAQTQGSCPSSNPKELPKLKPKGAAQAQTRRTSPGRSRAAQTQGSCPSSTQGSCPNSKPKSYPSSNLRKLPNLKPKGNALPKKSALSRKFFPYNILSLQHPNEVSKTCLTLRPGCDARQSTLCSPELIIYI